MPSALAICAALAIASGSSAAAATYFWDSDGAAAGNDINTGAGLGGVGNWNTSSPLWFDTVTSNDIVWPNTNPNSDTAVFTGTGGAVTIGSGILVNTLQFNSNGYTITNGGTAANTLTLSGPTPTINVATSGHNAVINALIAGSGGLTKTGAGTLTLNLTGNTFTGDVLVSGGTLAFLGSGNADQTAFGPGAKTITLTNNATLALIGGTDADPNVASGKGFVIGSGGGTIDVISGRTFFLNDGVSNQSGQNQLQGSGTLTKTGAGVLNVGRDFASTFSGDVNVKLGRLDITVPNAVGNVGTITVDGTAGESRLNLNTGTAFGLTNDVVLQNGGILSLTGGNHNLANNKSITVGAGGARIRVDDSAAATISGTTRTFVLNGALNGSNTLRVTGPNGTGRGVLAISNAASNFSGTIVIDKNVSVENFARWNGTTATTTGKTLGTALIKFEAVSSALGGSGGTLDGQLDLRDSGTGNNQVFNYENNVDMTSTGGIIAVGTNTGAAVASTGGRFVLGTLGLGDGNTLTVNTTNAYSLEFAGATTMAGAATFAGSSDLTLSGGISSGTNLTKNSTGRLTIGAPAGATTYTGTTAITAGGIVFNSANAIGGSGTSVTLGNGTYIGANFAATQANLVSRLVANNSTSVIALGQNSAENFDLTALPNARLGSVGNVTYTGTLTQADASTVRLGGGGGTLILPGTNRFTGSRNLDIGTSGTPAGVVAIDDPQDFAGSITLSGGQLLRIGGNSSLGNAANVITASGGGIQFKDAAAGFDIFATRTVNFTGGFILDTNGADLSTTVAIGNNGTGDFTKAGAGKLTLSQASTYNGKTILTGGTLSISVDNMLGTAPGSTIGDQLQISNNATLQITGNVIIPVARGITLTANGGGATFDVTDSNTLTVQSVIASTNGQITKSGTGTMLITADPNNTGGFTINGGVLALQHGGSTDGHFVINESGTLRVLTANDLGDAYNVTVNNKGTFDLRANDQISQLLGSGTVLNDGDAAATLTVSTGTNATFDGVIKNGKSALNFTKSGANVVTLTGTNTYTGTTTINSAALVVNGPAGAIIGTTTVNVGDNNGGGESLTVGGVNDVVTGPLNRLADNANLTINGTSTGGFTYIGPAAGSSNTEEKIGTLTAAAGRNTFTLTPGTNNQVQFTAGTFVRNNAGTIVIRGENLEGTGVGSARFVVTDPAGLPLSGAGGADGSSTKSIIPFAIGDNSSTGAGSGFVTYDATNGVRLLTASEYDSSIAGASTLRNVSTAGGETVSSDVKINSLRLTGTAATTIAAGTRLTVNSGAVLFTDGSSIDGAGKLDFGSAEGIIHLAKNTTGVTAAINAAIEGSNGLILGRSSDVATGVITLGGDNTVVGTLTINQGTVNLTSSTALNDNVPMTVTLRPNTALGLNGNNVTIRDLQASAGTGTFQNNSATTAATLTTYLTGNRSVNTVIQNGGTAALNLVVSGGNTLTIDQDASATGTFEQRVGTTALTGANGTLNDFTSYAINGGTLRLTNASGSANTNRLRDASAVTMNAGTLDFDNNGGAAFSETVGAVTLNSGANTITVDKGNSTANSSVLTLASLARNPGATLNLTSQSNGTAIYDLGTLANSRLVLTAVPTAVGGIIGGWATIDSSANTREFVKYVSSGTVSATALGAADYTGTLTTGSNPAQNVKITATPLALTGDTQINSLNLAQASASTLNLGGKTLRLESGGVIVSGAFSSSFTNGNLTMGVGANGGGDLAFHVLPNTSSGLTWANASDTITLSGVESGTPIVFSTAPGGLAANRTYYAVNTTATTFQVALTPGGTPIAITNDGTTGALTQFNSTNVGAVITNNGTGVVNLVKAGNGVLALSGDNTFTGKTYINGGTLSIDRDANLGGGIGSFAADKIVLSSNSTLEVASTMTLDPNRGITVGGGTANVISIPSGTAGNGKTLTYNGAISSLGSTEGSLQFRSNTNATNTDPGKIDATFSRAVTLNGSLTVDAGSVTLTGATNNIGRSLNIGTDGAATLTYTGAGNRLVIGKGINDTLNVGAGVGDNIANQGTLNLTGLGNLTANVDSFQLGVATAGRTGKGTAVLAINNDIVAGTAVNVGFSNGSDNTPVSSSLTFGSGINNVTTKTFTVGGNKSVGNTTVAAGGVVNLNGFGSSTLDLLVGSYGNTGTYSTTASTFDMSGGTLNASLNRLAIAEKTGGSNGAVSGTFTVTGNDNQISANSVTIANISGNTTAETRTGTGILNFGGGSFDVAGDVSIALAANNTLGTFTTNGTLNITGGTFTVGGNINTSNTGNATSTLNLSGGTLDLTGGNINVDAFNAQSGVLRNVNQVYNGDGATAAALTKTGTGTLEIQGSNNYTGGTAVNEGTLLVNGSINGSVTTSANTTLGGDGIINGPVNIASGATLSPGAGASAGSLDINGGVTLADNSTLKIQINGATAGTGYDQLNMTSSTGSVSLGSNVALSLSLGFTPNTTTDTFYYILTRDDNGVSYGNLFAGLGEGAKIDLGSGVVGTLTYLANWTGNAATSTFTGGNDVAIAVPEPGTLTTLFGGIGALVGLGRFRRRQARA